VSSEATLDPAGRAIIAKVRAKMPVASRKCVVYLLTTPMMFYRSRLDKDIDYSHCLE